MAFGSFDKGGPAAPMAEINTTPLVDVMLVLLVVFIITTPLLTNNVALDLPKAAAAMQQNKPEQIKLAIDANGDYFWNGQAIDPAALNKQFATAVHHNPAVELQLSADKNVRYERVATTLAAAQQNGVSKIGFITAAP